MTSPHERDGKFYSLNEDPYTRSPYVDPATGNPPTQHLPPQQPDYQYSDIDRYEDPRPQRQPKATPRNSNRQIGLFLGGLVATAVCAMIAAYIVFVVVVAAIYRQLGEHGYWADHNIVAPAGPTADVVLGLTVLAVLVAGAIMWLLTLTTPIPSTFFTILGVSLSLLAVVWLLQGADIAVSAPLAVATAIVSIGIVAGVAMCGKTLVAGSEAK